MDKVKKSYHFNISEVEDNKIKEVMNFNFGGHHDLAAMVQTVINSGEITEKHAKELVVGVRLLHHVLKKYPENATFKAFFPAFEDFKHALKAKYGCTCDQK